jgi:hypothetical protein
LRAEIDQSLPRGSWQALLLCLIDAASAGHTDSSGAVDLFAVEQELDSDARQRLGEAAALDAEFDADTPPSDVLADMLGWFRKRQESEIAQGITRQLRANDTNLSETDTTNELQRRLEAKRAAMGLSRN